MSEDKRRMYYALVGSDPPHVDWYVEWQYDGEKGCSRETFDTAEEAQSAYRKLFEHATVYGVVTTAMTPAPAWTSTPPTEPGWYWTRFRATDGGVCSPVNASHFDGEYWAHFGFLNEDMARREFWPVRIEEPKP